MMTTPDERKLAEQLRTGMNALHQTTTGLMPAEMAALDSVCNQVELFTQTNEHDPDLKAWCRAAVATKRLLRDHSAETKREWLDSYAGLPPMGW